MDSHYFPETVNNTSFGTFYPYRDICSKPKDPVCLNPSTYYKYFSIPSHIAKSHVFILRSASTVIFNRTLPVMKNITLTTDYLGCSSGGTYFICNVHKLEHVQNDVLLWKVIGIQVILFALLKVISIVFVFVFAIRQLIKH